MIETQNSPKNKENLSIYTERSHFMFSVQTAKKKQTSTPKIHVLNSEMQGVRGMTLL